MNLIDAFCAQNKLHALMDEASCILQDRDNVLKVTTTHLRSKVMPETQDAVVEDTAPSEYAEYINQVFAKLDQCIVNTVVEYVLPFEMNDSFDVILSDFIQSQ